MAQTLSSWHTFLSQRHILKAPTKHPVEGEPDVKGTGTVSSEELRRLSLEMAEELSRMRASQDT